MTMLATSGTVRHQLRHRGASTRRGPMTRVTMMTIPNRYVRACWATGRVAHAVARPRRGFRSTRCSAGAILGDTRITQAQNTQVNRASHRSPVVWWTADLRRTAALTAPIAPTPSQSGPSPHAPHVGRRRARVQARVAPTAPDGPASAPPPFAIASPRCMHADSTGLAPATERSCVGGHAARVEEIA